MQIKDIPAYVTPIPLSSFCDIDNCPYTAEFHYHNQVADPDAFQVWHLCSEHSDQLDERIARNKVNKRYSDPSIKQ